MKYLGQIIIILAFSFVGEILSYLIPLPVPASIYGILLLFAALVSGRLKVSSIRETSSLLIDLMPLMFVAPAVGLMDAWDLIAGSLVQYVLLIVVTTVLVMGVTGLITQKLLDSKGKGKGSIGAKETFAGKEAPHE